MQMCEHNDISHDVEIGIHFYTLQVVLARIFLFQSLYPRNKHAHLTKHVVSYKYIDVCVVMRRPYTKIRNVLPPNRPSV